jgi:hypothetical protein
MVANASKKSISSNFTVKHAKKTASSLAVFLLLLNPEDDRNMLPRNACNYLPFHMA